MKVLIAEDDLISRRLLQDYLTRWGYEVTAAEEGDSAWRLFEADDFPMVITDWVMPGLDGVELVRRIRAAPRPGYVYAILLTGKGQKSDIVQGMEAGADDFIVKPFDRDELRVRISAGERVIRLEHTLAEQNRTLRETQAALVQSEKLGSLGRLASGMAHEINNPLAYVTNNLTVLRRDTFAALAVLEAYERGRDILARNAPEIAAEIAHREEEADLPFFRAHLGRTFDKTLEGLKRVRNIVINLRDFARLDEAEFKEVDLNEAARSSLEVLHHDFVSQGVEATTDFEAVPPILGHPGKINQVLLNLLSNAVQACPAGGQVTVRTRPAAGGGAVVEVVDTGCGIAPEHRPRLFEPFFTTKPVGQGTGLGLAVSFGIVRDHGGTIEVDSAVGRGTTFRVFLPARPPAPPAPAGLRPSPPPPADAVGSRSHHDDHPEEAPRSDRG